MFFFINLTEDRKVKINKYFLITIIFITFLSGCAGLHPNKDIIYQTSTINALLQGVYDGEITFKELKRHGDFGIGTFNRLDGEMIGLDEKFYQIKSDGLVYPVADLMKTPFAVVTFFDSDKSIILDKTMSYEQMNKYLDELIPTKNIFYAVKIDGRFKFIKTRSVPRQNKPYPLLVDVVKKQQVTEYKDIKGTLVGFRAPEYVEGLNVAGYHFHFISEDKKVGGHVIDYQIDDGRIEIDYTSEFNMILPENPEFYNLNLKKDNKADLKKVEKE